MLKLLRACMWLIVAAAAAPLAARAQSYPARAITMVVPFPPGGVTDTLARLLGERMGASLGQSIVIDNVSGGSGAIGVGRVARSAPDGYTIVLGNLEVNVTNAISLNLNFDVFADFAPVVLLPSYPMLIVSKNEVPAKTLPELVAWLGRNQSTVMQGTVGVAGSIQHLCGVRMQKMLGMKWGFVPYRGGPQALQDMVGGSLDVMCTATGSYLPQVRAGQVRGYAITADKRMEAAPEIPTVDEAGALQGLRVGVWNAIWAPANTPRDMIEKLNAAANEAMRDPALRKRIVDMGLDPPPTDKASPAALGAYQRAEADVWWPIMRELDLPKN